jgi:histidine triad (HIT) family protein
MNRCTFCAIAAGERDGDIVLDETDVVAFLDARPLFPGHVLVIPRSHVPTIEDVDDALARPLFAAVRRLSMAVRRAVDAEGTFVAANNRVSQSVPHLHVHVVPRRRGDGLRGFFWPRVGYDDDSHRRRVAARIRELLPEAHGPA